VLQVCLAPANGRNWSDGLRFDLNDLECPKTEPNQYLPSNEGTVTGSGSVGLTSGTSPGDVRGLDMQDCFAQNGHLRTIPYSEFRG
jgi:hypothetical protein